VESVRCESCKNKEFFEKAQKMKSARILAIFVLVLVLRFGGGAAWGYNWAVQIVDGEESGSETGTFSNIVVDSQDRPRISYYDGGDNCLRFGSVFQCVL